MASSKGSAHVILAGSPRHPSPILSPDVQAEVGTMSDRADLGQKYGRLDPWFLCGSSSYAYVSTVAGRTVSGF